MGLQYDGEADGKALISSWRLRFAFGALVVSAVASFFATSPGCKKDEKLPPPLTKGPPNKMSTGGAVGSGGGAGAPPNACECLSEVAAAGTDGGASVCAGCVDHATQTGQICATAATACHMDSGCVQIQSCVSGCSGNVACMKGCMLPFDADASHVLFQTVTACACGSCGDECVAPMPIECSGTGGAGGSGGAGTGGAGGAGGNPPLENCACLVSSTVSDCKTCEDGVASPGQPCSTVSATCVANAGCTAITDCIGATSCTTASCITACMSGNPTGVDAFNAYASCVCQQCVTDCNSKGACPP